MMDLPTFLAELRQRESELTAARGEQQLIIDTQRRVIDGIDERLHELRGMILVAEYGAKSPELPAPAHKAKRRNLRALLLGVLGRLTEPTLAELLVETGWPRKDLNRALTALVKAGEVNCVQVNGRTAFYLLAAEKGMLATVLEAASERDAAE